MPSITRAGRATAAAAAAALLLATAPSAMAATSSASGKITPDKGPVGTPVDLNLSFRIDPDPGKEPGTLTKVEVLLPPNGRPNGRLFPSCSADQIMARNGKFTQCPKGSLIGKGTGRSDVPAIPVNNVPVRFTIFNGPRGRSVTLHVYAINPVLISHAFDVPITKVGGRFGYKLTANVPEILQEINGPGGGWFVGLRTFNSTIRAKIRDRRTGRMRGYVETTTLCPKSGSVPLQFNFDFLRDNPRSTANGVIRCRR